MPNNPKRRYGGDQGGLRGYGDDWNVGVGASGQSSQGGAGQAFRQGGSGAAANYRGPSIGPNIPKPLVEQRFGRSFYNTTPYNAKRQVVSWVAPDFASGLRPGNTDYPSVGGAGSGWKGIAVTAAPGEAIYDGEGNLIDYYNDGTQGWDSISGAGMLGGGNFGSLFSAFSGSGSGGGSGGGSGTGEIDWGEKAVGGLSKEEKALIAQERSASEARLKQNYIDMGMLGTPNTGFGIGGESGPGLPTRVTGAGQGLALHGADWGMKQGAMEAGLGRQNRDFNLRRATAQAQDLARRDDMAKWRYQMALAQRASQPPVNRL